MSLEHIVYQFKKAHSIYRHTVCFEPLPLGGWRILVTLDGNWKRVWDYDNKLLAKYRPSIETAKKFFKTANQLRDAGEPSKSTR